MYILMTLECLPKLTPSHTIILVKKTLGRSGLVWLGLAYHGLLLFAMGRYGLLLLRNVQGMTATHFSDFMSRWGRLQPDYQVDQDMSFEPSESTERSPMVFGNGGAGEHLYSDAWSWHFDGEDMPWLHSYTSLYCLIRPHEGHSTGFAATNRCVDFMPEELRFLLEGARAEYSTDDIVES